MLVKLAIAVPAKTKKHINAGVTFIQPGRVEWTRSPDHFETLLTLAILSSLRAYGRIYLRKCDQPVKPSRKKPLGDVGEVLILAEIILGLALGGLVGGLF